MVSLAKLQPPAAASISARAARAASARVGVLAPPRPPPPPEPRRSRRRRPWTWRWRSPRGSGRPARSASPRSAGARPSARRGRALAQRAGRGAQPVEAEGRADRVVEPRRTASTSHLAALGQVGDVGGGHQRPQAGDGLGQVLRRAGLDEGACARPPTSARSNGDSRLRPSARERVGDRLVGLDQAVDRLAAARGAAGQPEGLAAQQQWPAPGTGRAGPAAGIFRSSASTACQASSRRNTALGRLEGGDQGRRCRSPPRRAAGRGRSGRPC